MPSILNDDNAYWVLTSGNGMITTNVDDAANTESVLRTLLRKSFLENGEPNTVFMQLGQPAVSQNWYKTVTRPRLNVMRTWDGFDSTVDTSYFDQLSDAYLTEWVTPAGHKNTVSTITATPVQLWDYTVISDLLDAETLLPLIAAQGKELGNNAGRVIDTYIQSVLASDTDIGAIYAGTATARANLTAADTVDFDVVLKAITYISSQGVTNERIKVVMHPNVFRDFCISSSTNTWLNKVIYDDFKGIRDGFVTSIENFDLYVSANVKPFVVSGNDGFNVYPTYVLRKGAYGVSSLQTLQTFYKPYGSGGTDDPLNQRCTIWWKCAYGCATLNPFWIVRIESRAGTDYQWQEALS